MKQRRRIILAASLVAAAVLATIILFSLERSRQISGQQVGAEPVDIEAQVEGARTDETVAVQLFFHRPGALDPGGEFLDSEEREIPAIGAPELRARQIIAELFKGRSGGADAFPEQARLRQFYLLADGTAVVDLSRETAEGVGSGITRELAVIYSITRSLRENLEEVQQVLFLVEGENQDTLAGHVSIADPFR